MFKPPDQDKMSSEEEIRLFLRLFPILAAHFELKDSVLPLPPGIGRFIDQAKNLAEDYEEILDDEAYGTKSFVKDLPSVIHMPKIKKALLEEDD